MTEALSIVGREYRSARPYEVSREKIREFADALNDPNPVYRDSAAAHALGHPDVVAPPTFAMVIQAPTVDSLFNDPTLGIEYSHVVHGEQRFAYNRPVHAGDVLDTVVTIEDVRSIGGNEMITYRSDITTTGGEPVLVARSLIVVRGGGTGGDAV
ncbi:MAG TPA: MaoC family dehydratase N-terminal domain-containing protein [Jatrophihabitans sp.]|jgi:acyl dehydratase